jgi:hypothetical protein
MWGNITECGRKKQNIVWLVVVLSNGPKFDLNENATPPAHRFLEQPFFNDPVMSPRMSPYPNMFKTAPQVTESYAL